MVIAKARIKIHEEYESFVPVQIPELDDVRRFAADLHTRGEAWTGEVFGWTAEYNPERSEPPLDSRLTFTPADFCIGESGIWFFSLMWEHGKDAPPVEFLDDQTTLSDPKFLASIAEARRQVQEGRTVSHSDLKKDLGLE